MGELSNLAQVLNQTPAVERAQEAERAREKARKRQAARRLADRAEIRGHQVEEAPETQMPGIEPEKESGGEVAGSGGQVERKPNETPGKEESGDKEKGGTIDLRA